MDETSGKIRWPHAPPHFVVGTGPFMMTASTYGRSHHFGSRKRLRFLTDTLLNTADRFGWRLEAWAVMANHYHWIGKSPDTGAEELGQLMASLRTGWNARPEGMAQFLGNAPDFREVLPRPPALCESESSETRTGSRGRRLSVVFGSLVFETCDSGLPEDCRFVQNRPTEN